MFPTQQAYLAALPGGFDSFPTHRARASMVRAALSLHGFRQDQQEALPVRLRRLVEEPPLPSRWVFEVEYIALCLALCDAHEWSEPDFGRFWYDLTKSLMNDKLYSRVLGFLTPKLLLRTASVRWAAFHHGVQLSTRPAPGGLYLDLKFPKGLMPPICTAAYADVFQATVDFSAARAQTRLVESGPTEAVYLMSERG